MHVLIICQSDINRIGLKSILQQFSSDCVLKEVETLKEAIAITDNIYPDLIIICLDRSEGGGIDILNEIKKSRMTRNLIIISSVKNPTLEYLAFDMGINAFISCQEKKEIIVAVFKIVIAGGKYFSPAVMIDRQNDFSEKLCASEKRFNLTNRQKDVLKLMGDGKSNKDIANELGIAPGTVKIHIAGILKSLNAQNRTQAVNTAIRFNLI